MGQCLSNPGDDKLKPRKRLPSLTKRESRRRKKEPPRRPSTQSVQQHERHRPDAARHPPDRSSSSYPPSTSAMPRVDVQAVVEDDPELHRSSETGSDAIAETEGSEPLPKDYLSQAPQPQKLQDVQENDDQDDDLFSDPHEEDSHEPPPAEEINDDLREEFCQKLSQLLASKMEEKDKKFVEYTAKPTPGATKSHTKGFEAKRVSAESLDMESGQPGTMPKLEPESMLTDTAGAGSSMGQSSKETSLFAVQKIDFKDIHQSGKIGSGRSGLVRLAHWYGAEVALKIFYGHSSTAENDKAMHQETKTLAMLKHPSVVALYGICENSDRPTIVLEYVSGGSLKSQLQRAKKERGRTGGMSAHTRTRIALQASYAMEYFHSRDIIHFDIKAENFLCDLRDPNHPVVKIADVGLSRYNVALYVTSNMRGTLPWMAPELFPQIQRKHTPTKPYHDKDVNFKVDVYSFGIVLWEIWNLGEDPYPNKTAADVLYRILEGNLRPTIPRDCPHDWAYLMQLCWDENPTVRPNFKTISHQLECILKKL